MSRAEVGVYVHIPFCERVCPYCDFAVVGVRELGAAQEQRTIDALLRELEGRRADFAGRTLASLYFGGGTPSLCRPESLARLAVAVHAAFPSVGPVETTLEVNPSSLERERLPGFRAAGVNRVSLGVQSFDDGVLKRLGRAHRADEARRTLRACREAGFDALSLDLIFAAPGQSLGQLEADLAETLEFGPEHVSAYELGIESGTPFATAAARGQLALPDEDLALAMFDAIEAALTAAGFEHYEIANYARPGFPAVHNQRYWRRLPVLGLGPGAFSTDPTAAETPFGVRRANLRDHAAWLARIEAGEAPEATPPERLDAPTARAEAMFLSLRTRRGVDAAAFAGEFGRPPRAFFEVAIEGLLAQALLRENAAGDLQLTGRGRRLSNEVFGHFVGGVS
ncbi:MAG: radical SAM family heme chaperone HemW [Deltaproteobacteria bacterium]|nr:radical SAM family heme chaperone HemW [Deltaproteobacteria bacterium]